MRILTFHGIGKPRRELETGEAPYWLDEDRFLDILGLVASHASEDAISITFDDGNVSDYQIALPALLDRGMEATFFVLAGRIDGGGSLSTTQIRALSAAGMAIGSHGIAHVDWTRLGAAELDHELRHSKATLERVLGAEVDSVSIPFGRYNARVLRAIRQAGYRRAFSSDGGETDDGDFPMSRTSPTKQMSDEAVSDLIEGRTRIWMIARSQVSRLVKRLV